MFKKKRFLIAALALTVFWGMQIVEIHAEDELSNGLPEVITGMDEYGNVYEVDASSGCVNTTGIQTYSEEAKVVNFNTKGATITEYQEADTGASGYLCGTYGADAAYLGTNGSKVKFMISGVIGEVNADEVGIVDISAVNVLSHYIVADGRLYHKVATNLTASYYGSTLNQGAAPSYLSANVRYYSYDGHYFYTDYQVMIEDYQNNTRERSVNPGSPYFNYFQFLPLRSQSNYTSSQVYTFLNNRVEASSKLRDLGNLFVEDQNIYGINALLSIGVSANETNWGMSNIAQTKNNLFGLNAVDSSPGQSANYYSDVNACIKDFMETYMSKQYANPNNWKYNGAFLGNKASGINVRYASDPYWGEKAANVAWVLDYENGCQDAGAYTIGIKDLKNYEHTSLNVRKEATTSSTKLYNTGNQSAHAFIILGEENGFYKVQCDGVLNTARTEIDNTSGVYKFTEMYAYASKDYLTKVSYGGKVSDNSTWKALTIDVSESSPQLLQTEIKLTAQVNQKNEDLQYKFVWEKDDWQSWGVIQAFSTNDTATWMPEEGGAYKIYMDVQDSTGKMETVIIDYEIKDWGYSGIATNLVSPQKTNTAIQISPQIGGSQNGLQYKYVWEKDNWKSWGVIQGFSKNDTATWIPTEEGIYTIYVDVQDSEGYEVTRTLEYEVTNELWSLNGIIFNKEQGESGSTVIISADVDNRNANLEYKFVWEKNNWQSWGVIRDFSADSAVEWTPEESGTYRIYVDVQDASGEKHTIFSQYVVEKREILLNGITLNQNSPQEIGIEIKITPNVKGNTENLEYKYVWEKDNWKSWGVIQNFSENTSCKWIPYEAGDYHIYVDARARGTTETVSANVPFKVNWGTWSVAGMNFDLESPQIPSAQIEIAARILGNKTGLEYKFVWEKDNWKSWGVIQQRSVNSKTTWIPEEAGDYNLYLDVFDSSGKSVTYVMSYKVEDWIIVTKPLQIGNVNETVNISIDGIKHSNTLEYKYVWEKDNWQSWDVIQAFSEKQIAAWIPTEPGIYRLYVDVRNTETNEIETKWIYYEVN